LGKFLVIRRQLLAGSLDLPGRVLAKADFRDSQSDRALDVFGRLAFGVSAEGRMDVIVNQHRVRAAPLFP